MSTASTVTTHPEADTPPFRGYVDPKTAIPATIPESFTTPGFSHRLLDRDGDLAIYAQTHRAAGRLMAYEVVRVRRHKTTRLLPGGTNIMAGTEYLPGAGDWGSHGWTLPTRTAAQAKAAE